jgi:hypothetical protein
VSSLSSFLISNELYGNCGVEEAWSPYLGYCERFLKDQASKQLAAGGDSKITEFSNIGYRIGKGDRL